MTNIEIGFIKRAQEVVKFANTTMMENLVRQAQLPTIDDLVMQAMSNGVGGAAIGGAAGAGLGYLGGRNKEHPEHDHSIRNALLGGVAGAGLGGVGTGAISMGQQMREHPYVRQ